MSESLIIPVYLNQRIVFDLLAMLEGGISQVTRVAAIEETREATERRFGAEFGLSKALASLFSIGVSGSRTRTGGTGETHQTSEEKVHTPASLFYRLRERLREEGHLQDLKAGDTPRVHDLVEFPATLTRNPLIQVMDAFKSLMEMAVPFTDEGGSPKSAASKQAKGSNQRIAKQMSAFRDTLAGGDTVDIVARGIAGEHQAVVTLEVEYLNDPTMADLADGSFKVVGKVTRVVSADGGGISLLRKSALTIMPTSTLDKMVGALKQLSESQDFNLPDLEWEIPAPAMQVIPIAIIA